ncbi:hypothetical protein DDI_4366 [Dickeya dianthicola RNS04.9]|nr:hypothetical protein DDI_4366 [Dickeya dianthicola RNS04.9]
MSGDTGCPLSLLLPVIQSKILARLRIDTTLLRMFFWFFIYLSNY